MVASAHWCLMPRKVVVRLKKRKVGGGGELGVLALEMEGDSGGNWLAGKQMKKRTARAQVEVVPPLWLKAMRWPQETKEPAMRRHELEFL